MKQIVCSIALALILALAAAAGATEQLHILTGADITPPAVVERFERENDIRLHFDFFDSPEALGAYINANQRGDLALLRGHYVGKLIQSHQLMKLDHALLPNLKNLDLRSRNSPIDPDNLYSIPYIKGTLGIIYRRGSLGAEKPSWSHLFSQGQSPASPVISSRRNTLRAEKASGPGQGHSSVPFAVTDRYRDAMGLAQSYLGYSYNSTSPLAIGQGAELMRVLVAKPAFMGFMSPEKTLKFLKEKFIYAAVSYNNLAAAAMAQDPGLDFSVPDRNGMAWSYVYVVNAKTARAKAAYKWLNFLMEPEVAAEVSVWNKTSTPNEAARPLLPPEIRDNPVIYPPDAVWETSEFPLSLDDEAERMSIDYWSHLK